MCYAGLAALSTVAGIVITVLARRVRRYAQSNTQLSERHEVAERTNSVYAEKLASRDDRSKPSTIDRLREGTF